MNANAPRFDMDAPDAVQEFDAPEAARPAFTPREEMPGA